MKLLITFGFKSRISLCNKQSIRFIDITFKKDSHGLKLVHDNQFKNITTLGTSFTYKTEFISRAYIASVCQLDLTSKISVATQVTDLSIKDIHELNKVIYFAFFAQHQVLTFIPLNDPSLYIAVFVDASVATNCESLYKLGILVTIPYKSDKCKFDTVIQSFVASPEARWLLNDSRL